MIFSIQRFSEDYFQKLGLTDNDQYSVKVANFYAQLRPDVSETDALSKMHRIRTSFFRVNFSIKRLDFERELLKILKRGFQKKNYSSKTFPSSLQEAQGH
jgi:hypothetical protein